MKTLLVDLAERVGSTFAQVFLAVVLAVAGTHVDWGNAAAIAAFAAITALLTTLLSWGLLNRVIHNAYLDLVYRSALTFGQTLAGLLVAAGAISALEFGWTAALKTALIAAGTALLKGLIGMHAPATLGAATFVQNSSSTPTRAVA